MLSFHDELISVIVTQAQMKYLVLSVQNAFDSIENGLTKTDVISDTTILRT